MAVRRWQFSSYHPVLRHQLHSGLNFASARWNWAVGGNGTLQGAITVPNDEDQVAAIKAATERLASAIYVRSAATNAFIWGGPVVERKWDGARLSITCIEWRSWPFQLVVPPGVNADIYYDFTAQDQLYIARTILQAAVATGAPEGGHPLTYNSTASGKLRDLHFYGSELKRAGELIDSMANRDGGFEWTLSPQVSSDGLPRMNFTTYFPQQGSVLEGLVFKATSRGGNCVPGEITESGSQLYSRFYGTGTGQAPDQLFAKDEDPGLSSGAVLRFDGSASYTTISDRLTLASNLRRARRFYQPGINLITIAHNLQQIDPDSYSIGDRARLIVKDRFTNIDRSQVRIIEKEIDTSGAGSVRVTLDLTDDTLPEVDTGGAV